MNPLSRVAVLLTVALGVLVPMTPAPALADPIGGLIIIPGTGTDVDPIRLRTSAGCPAQANAFYARMRGHDFPPDGQIITANTKAGLSHNIGFDVYVALIMRDYADRNRTTLAGRYDITVHCINRLTLESYGEFTGSLEFTSPTTYQAIGAAKPVGPPPPPRELTADGSAVDPGAAGPPAPPLAAQVPRSDPKAQSRAGQLASQRNDMTFRPWLMPSLVGAVLGAAMVIGIVTRQVRKRRAS
jgi:hypothetical protein